MSTVFVTLCDKAYFERAKTTIHELRTFGQWRGDVVLIAVDFTPELDNVIVFKTTHIPTDHLVEVYKQFPLHNTDGRHLQRLIQWDKLQVFREFFRRWERVVFVDAGMHIYSSVYPILELEWKGKFLAPDDTMYPDLGVRFHRTIETESNPVAYQALISEFSESILNERFFVNCVFVFDTSLVRFEELLETMDRYPLFSCNEMGIMNLVFTFRHKVWTPFPKMLGNKYTFGWNESHQNATPGTWRDFIFMKYPFALPVYDKDTVFVTLCDKSYLSKATHTIHELQTNGRWMGDTVLMSVDFQPEPIPNVQLLQIRHIPTDKLVKTFETHPLKPMSDNRHLGKLYQWDKLQVFHSYFRRWKRVMFLDAGMRVFNSVQPLLDLEWKGKFLAPDDSDPYDNGLRFNCQLDVDANPEVTERVYNDFSKDILDKHYFLNCIFVFDTALLEQVSVEEMEDAMNAYPICMCNEMGIMNLIFNYKLNVWLPFPQNVGEKYLFGWSERNYREQPNWSSFHFIKYSLTA